MYSSGTGGDVSRRPGGGQQCPHHPLRLRPRRAVHVGAARRRLFPWGSAQPEHIRRGKPTAGDTQPRLLFKDPGGGGEGEVQTGPVQGKMRPEVRVSFRKTFQAQFRPNFTQIRPKYSPTRSGMRPNFSLKSKKGHPMGMRSSP